MTITVTATWATVGTLTAALVVVAVLGPGVWQAAHGRFYAHPVTWVAWAALGIVALVAQIEMGGFAAVVFCWTLGVAACAMAVVAVAVAFTGRTLSGLAPTRDVLAWQWRVDIACMIGSAAAFLFLLRSTAEAAMILTITTDVIAAVPTVVAAWRAPQTQSWLLYCGVAVASALAVIAGGRPAQLVDVVYPIYIFLLDVVIFAVIVGRDWWLDRRSVRYVGPPTIPIVLPVSAVPFRAAHPGWASETPYDAYVRGTLATRPPTVKGNYR